MTRAGFKPPKRLFKSLWQSIRLSICSYELTSSGTSWSNFMWFYSGKFCWSLLTHSRNVYRIGKFIEKLWRNLEHISCIMKFFRKACRIKLTKQDFNVHFVINIAWKNQQWSSEHMRSITNIHQCLSEETRRLPNRQ